VRTPGEHERRDQRRLDPPQLLPRGHPHRVRRLAHRGVEVGQRGHAVAQDRQQRVERERQQRGQEAERGNPTAEERGEREQQRVEQRQQRQRGDRLDEPGETEGDARDMRVARGPDDQRQRHRYA
jgi:hypothetical protein